MRSLGSRRLPSRCALLFDSRGRADAVSRAFKTCTISRKRILKLNLGYGLGSMLVSVISFGSNSELMRVILTAGKHFKSYLERAMSNIRQEDPDAAPVASPTTSPTAASKPSMRPISSAASPTAPARPRVPSGQANSEALNRLHSLFGFAAAGQGKPRNGLA